MSERDEVIARLEFVANVHDRKPSSVGDWDVGDVCRAAIRLLREPVWQPIETAPKNGRPVLVAWANKPTWAPVTAYVGDGQWHDEDEAIYRDPTHWMPLPDPPKEGDSK